MKIDMISECADTEILRMELSKEDIGNVLDGGKIVWEINPRFGDLCRIFHRVEVMGEKSIRRAAEYIPEEVKYIE